LAGFAFASNADPITVETVERRKWIERSRPSAIEILQNVLDAHVDLENKTDTAMEMASDAVTYASAVGNNLVESSTHGEALGTARN
jgi:hypothetical protein